MGLFYFLKKIDWITSWAGFVMKIGIRNDGMLLKKGENKKRKKEILEFLTCKNSIKILKILHQNELSLK